jgi:hypothetical protein
MTMPARLFLLACGIVLVVAPGHAQDGPRRPIEPPAAATFPEARRGMGIGRGLLEPPRSAMPIPGWVQETVTRSVELGPRGIFVLKNGVGEVRITGTDGNTVKVTAIKRVKEQNKDAGRALLQNIGIRLTERGGGVEVFTENAPGSMTPTLVDYDVSLPTAAQVTITNTGTVRIQNVKGELRAEAFQGNISLFNVGRVRLAKTYGNTINNMPGGNIVIIGAEGEEVSAEATLNGAIRLQNVRARNVELRVLFGNISASNVECDGCEFNSFGGDMEFSGTLRRNARYDIVSSSGNIRMFLDGNVGFDLEAVGSAIRVAPDFQLKQSSPPSPSSNGRSLLGTSGDASAILSLRTFKGSITVARPPAGGPR